MKKLHNRRQPAGLERVILRTMPGLLLGGIFIPLLMSIFIRVPAVAGLFATSSDEIAKLQTTIDILGIAIFFMVLSAAFTITIGCVIVMLMKGPAYIADGYKLEDSDGHDEKDSNRTDLEM
jgi:hypothetical protein